MGDAQFHQQPEETLALLKLLALGGRDIEQGRFRDAETVIADLDKEDGE